LFFLHDSLVVLHVSPIFQGQPHGLLRPLQNVAYPFDRIHLHCVQIVWVLRILGEGEVVIQHQADPWRSSRVLVGCWFFGIELGKIQDGTCFFYFNGKNDISGTIIPLCSN
jgi:hypothetical protein